MMIHSNVQSFIEIFLTIAPWPFLIFLTKLFWRRRNGLSSTPWACVPLPYNFKQNTLAEERSGSTGWEEFVAERDLL